MTLALSLVDNQDGTGAVATISGSAGGANTVFTQRVDLVQNAGVWTSSGTRTGDGTVSLALSPAYYWAYVQNVNGGVTTFSPLVYFLASRASQAELTRYLNALQGTIQTLTLNGLATPPGNIPAARVYRFDTLCEEIMLLMVFPCVVISTIGAEQYLGGTNARDDIGFPGLVSIIDRRSPHDATGKDSYYLWRQQISRAIRHQRLAGLSEFFTTEVEPRDINAWKPPENEVYYSAQLFRGKTRDPRGV